MKILCGQLNVIIILQTSVVHKESLLFLNTATATEYDIMSLNTYNIILSLLKFLNSKLSVHSYYTSQLTMNNKIK